LNQRREYEQKKITNKKESFLKIIFLLEIMLEIEKINETKNS
jgi:hypothetical protein